MWLVLNIFNCVRSQCVHVPRYGFRRGGYRCHCIPGFYFPVQPSSGTQVLSTVPGISLQARSYFNGSDVEKQYALKLSGDVNTYDDDFHCLPCPVSCVECTDDTPCYQADYNVIRMLPVAIQCFTMTISFVVGIIIVRVRKTKVCMTSSSSECVRPMYV